MTNGLPEDANRLFIIGYYLADDTLAVWERRTRNSGFAEGKFAERRLRVNPLTGVRYATTDFFVGAHVRICSQNFKITRSDEYSLRHMENTGGSQFPMCDIGQVLTKIKGLKNDEDFVSLSSVAPDQLANIAQQKLGVTLEDQEIITTLRRCGQPGGGQPFIPVPLLLDYMP